ncbi:hypothetical protein J2O02_18225 (plasmid) [Elizabethkingia anophelis]|uniref:hypothetical protein n=1 Tax=Elizabethkingia anophelis TaxID=1117645 RepID=UPI0020B748A6|nr:hypothetical protein [Elizabethkingia anophelis]UTG66803.1 hypothetical protein J2O02_18225 [Elizabethkingia anophelis]
MDDKTENKVTIIFIVIISLAVILGIIYFATSNNKVTRENKTLKARIYSLKGQSNIEGSFYLGYGHINTVDYYVFFMKDEKKNGFYKETIPVEKTLLIEKDTVPNVVRNYLLRTELDNNIFKSKTIIDTIPYSIFNKIPSSIKYEYILTIPKGTITENLKYEP